MSSKNVINQTLLEDMVASKEFHLIQGTTTMICALKLVNGFTAIGQSASAPGVEFSPIIGMACAEADAMQKVAEIAAFLVYEANAVERVGNIVSKALTKLKELENGH